MATYRSSDHRGGCAGARVRLAPQKDWPANQGLGAALDLLAPVRARHPGLSWADLIVLAGGVALELAGTARCWSRATIPHPTIGSP